MRVFDRLPQSLRQMAVYGSGMVLMKAVSLLMVPVFTNFLSPADYGRLDVLQTLANLLSIVIAFGLSESLFRFAGEAADDKMRSRSAAEIYGFALAIGAISLVLTQVFAPEIKSLLPGSVTEMQVRLILGSLAVTGMILVPLSWLRMRDRALLYFSASAGTAVAQAGLSAVLLYLGFGVEGVLMSGLICMSITALVVFTLQTRDTGIRLNPSNFPRYGHFGGVLVFAGMAAFIMDSFPRWVLAGAVGPAEMAIFALAAKIAMIAGFLTHPFEMWWMPRRFAVLNEANGMERSARATEKGLVLALAAAIMVGATSPAVIRIMTPEAYHGAALFAPSLALLVAMNASVRLLNIGCLSKEKTVWPMVIDGTAAGAACLGYLAAVPFWGGWAIVAITAIALVGRIGAYLVIGHRIRAIPYAYRRLGALSLVAVATSVAMTLTSTVFGNLAIGTAAIAGLILLGVGLGLLPRPRTIWLAEANHAQAS